MVAQTDFDFLADLEAQPQTQAPPRSNITQFPSPQAQSQQQTQPQETYDFLADLDAPKQRAQVVSPVQYQPQAVQQKQSVSEVPDFLADFEQPNETYNSPFFESFDAFKPPKKETATEKKQSKLLESFSQGLKESTSGELAQQFFEPGTQEELVQDPTFWESLVKESGTIVGDIPYLAAGATLGAAIGSPGGPIGSTVGGAFGAMAVPAFLKESLKQYREYQESGKEDLTFGEFLQKADKVANRTLNEGLFGVILGATAKAVPMLQKLPGIGSLFNSKIAQTTSKVVAEAGVATAVPAAVQGRLPEAKDFAHALALFAGFNLAHLPANAREAIEKQGVKSGLTPEEFASSYNPEQLGRIQKVVEKNIYEEAKREQLPPVKEKPAPEKPEFVLEETRGQGKQFHGTPQELTGVDKWYRNPLSYYGSGFYTTDAVDIAKGYSTRRTQGKKNPTIYEVTPKADLKLLNMETPISELDPKVREFILGMAEERYGDLVSDSLSKDLSKQNLRELYDEMREVGSGENMSADEITDYFESLQNAFEDLGYRGLEHTGGLRTKNKPHTVKIYFDPEDDITIKKADLSYKRKVKPEFTARMLEHAEKMDFKKESYKQDFIEKLNNLEIGSAEEARDFLKGKVKFQEPSMQSRKFEHEKEAKTQQIRPVEPKKAEGATITQPVKRYDAPARKEPARFATAKGSTYEVHPDGTTTRTKAARPEHPGEEGLQPRSEKTFYVSQEQANKLSEFQTTGGPKKRIAAHPDGRVGVVYTEGANSGKFEPRTVVKPKLSPTEGLIPVELFDKGKRVHFGNPITSLGTAEAKAQAPDKKPFLTPAMKRILPQPPKEPAEALKNLEAKRASTKQGKTLDEAVSFEASEPKKKEPKNEFDFRRDIVDDLYPIKRFVESAGVESLSISEDPYKLARLYRGWSGKADTFLEFRTFDPETLKWKGKGFRSILEPVRDDLEGFSKYLVGKRAIELSAQKKETGIDLENAQDYVKANNSKYEKPAKELRKYQSDLLHYAEKSGLISPETRELWETMNENYVPFQRVLAEPNEEFINARTMQPKQQFYKLEGSKKPIIDPLESIVSNSYTLIRASEQNRVLRSLRDFNEKYKGSKEFIEVKELGESEPSLKNFSEFLKGEKVVDDDGVMRFFDNGKLVKMQVPAEVAEALKGIRSTEELNFIGRILNYPTRAVRAGAITLSPGTLAKLATIDQLEAFLYTDIGYIPYYDAAKGFFHAIKKDPLYYKWKAAGGDQSIATSLARSFKQQKLHNVATGKNTFDSFDSMLRAVENVSKPLEESTRLGVFEKALRRKGMSADDVRQAALEAREATLDFQRKGARTRLMAQAVPFFNASIQGAAKFFDHLKTDPKLLPKAITAVTIPTLINYYANKDRKEFQELPQWERDAFWHFYVDLPNGDTQHYKMPRPFELGAAFATVPERLAEYAYEQDKDSLAAIGENLQDTFLPSVMPAALTPFYEVATNKKLLTGAPLVTERMKNLPAEERHSPFTSETAKKISPILQKIPYVGEHASPVVIEEFLNAWTGNLGTAIVHYSEKGLEKAGVLPEKIRPEKDISDLPIFKVFVGKKGYTTQARSLKKFYEESDKLQKQYNAIKLASKEGRESNIEKPNEIAAKHKFAQRLRTAFSKSWTAIRNIQLDHDPEHYNEAEKKILIDAMIKDMVSISREFLGKER